MKTSIPVKQPQGPDGESSTGISGILFREVNNDDDQSQGNDNDVHFLILGQDPAITLHAGSELEQVSRKACHYQ